MHAQSESAQTFLQPRLAHPIVCTDGAGQKPTVQKEDTQTRTHKVHVPQKSIPQHGFAEFVGIHGVLSRPTPALSCELLVLRPLLGYHRDIQNHFPLNIATGSPLFYETCLHPAPAICYTCSNSPESERFSELPIYEQGI